MRKLLTGSIIALGLVVILYAASGTPNTLRVNTDANGNLVTTGATLTGATTSSVFSNTRLNTDSAGNLLVTLAANTSPFVGPASGTCVTPSYTFTNDTDTGLGWLGANNPALCAGGATILDASSTGVNIASGLAYKFNAGAGLFDDGANIVGLRNGSSAQAFNIYSTFTDASNYRRLGITMGATSLSMLSTGAGTGAAGLDFNIGTAKATALNITTNNAGRWSFDQNGMFITQTDNALDIGALGASRPRTGYFGTSIVSPILQGSGTGTSVANVGANSCGTTAATIAGNQVSGVITVGATAGTQCRVTFTTAAPVARDCTVTDSTTTIATRATVVDTSNTDFLGAFVAGDKVTYQCTVR